MKAAGIIAEYNPFHNGHLYHLNKTKSLTDADVVICVLSGDFVQRGEPALCSKFARTRMALSAGADIVIMLPFAYSCQSAEIFAYGAVNILNKLSCDIISFGCEDDNLDRLYSAANVLSSEEKAFSDLLKSHLSQGRSYAKSRQLAAEEYSPDITDVLCSPNNILAVEYLKQIILNDYPIKPLAVKRTGSHHDSKQPYNFIASASMIRETIKTPDGKYKNYIPSYVYEMLSSSPLNDMENYKNIIYQNLLTSTDQMLCALPEVSESLSNKIINNFKEFTSISDFINNMYDKHHTKTRIARSLINMLIGFDISYADIKSSPVPYARILGFTNKGRSYLNLIKNNSDFISNTNDYYSSSAGYAKKLFSYDLIASDVYQLGINGAKGVDYKTVPIYFD